MIIKSDSQNNNITFASFLIDVNSNISIEVSNLFDSNPSSYNIPITTEKNEDQSEKITLNSYENSIWAIPTFSIDTTPININELINSSGYSEDHKDLDLIIMQKFAQIPEVSNIYVEKQQNYLNVKVLLDIHGINYDLMNKIFEDIEYPIKRNSNKMIDFHYYTFDYIHELIINPTDNLIYTRPTDIGIPNNNNTTQQDYRQYRMHSTFYVQNLHP